MGGRKEEEQVCGRPSSCLPQDTCGPGAIQSPGHHSPSWGPCVTVQAPHLPRAPCSGPQGEPGKGSEPRQTAWSLMLIGLTDRKTGGQTTDDHPSLWPQALFLPFPLRLLPLDSLPISPPKEMLRPCLVIYKTVCPFPSLPPIPAFLPYHPTLNSPPTQFSRVCKLQRQG